MNKQNLAFLTIVAGLAILVLSGSPFHQTPSAAGEDTSIQVVKPCSVASAKYSSLFKSNLHFVQSGVPNPSGQESDRDRCERLADNAEMICDRNSEIEGINYECTREWLDTFRECCGGLGEPLCQESTADEQISPPTIEEQDQQDEVGEGQQDQQERDSTADEQISPPTIEEEGEGQQDQQAQSTDGTAGQEQ